MKIVAPIMGSAFWRSDDVAIKPEQRSPSASKKASPSPSTGKELLLTL